MPIFYKSMKSVIFDLRISRLVYYQDGKIHQQGQATPSEGVDWCLQNLDEGSSVFLIGSARETEGIFQQLNKYRLNICCYDVQQADPKKNINNSQISLDGVLSSLNEIKILLKREQPKSANYALINTSSPQCETKPLKN